MYETEVKKLYRAYNKHTRSYTKFFPTLADAAAFVVAQPKRHPRQGRYTDTLKLEADGKTEIRRGAYYCFTFRKDNGYPRPRYEYEYHPAPDWVIADDLGDLVPISSIDAALPRYRKYPDWDARYAERDRMEERRLKYRGDGLKIKTVYAVSHKIVSLFYGRGYRDNIRGYHRAIHTFRDHRINCGHVEEYGETLVRGRRRCLPTTYDDRQNGSYKLQDSWKGHSKRRKQWKPKG